MLLEETLAAAVPLHILDLKRQGGPADSDLEWAREFAWELGSHGDLLLYRGGKPGESARLFNQTARAIAILAFAPGGVHLFGQHWDASGGGG